MNEQRKRFFDTQLVSYAWKGRDPSALRGAHISSVVAREFLLAFGQGNTEPRYFIPVWDVPTALPLASSTYRKTLKQRGFSKRWTDSVVIDFGPQFPAIVDFGNIAMAQVLNSKHDRLFAQSIAPVEKRARKTIMQRFNFLLAADVQCAAVTRQDLDLALSLLSAFCEKHTVKARFRNTWNDILILASAARREADLLTQDSLLSRFAAEVLDGSVHQIPPKTLELAFERPRSAQPKCSRESKGFLNRGWQYRMRSAARR